MISKAMQKVGNEGVITVEEAKGIQTELMLLKECNLIEVTCLLILLQMQIK